MAKVGWPFGVNQVILDTTGITVGEGATVDDTLETGRQRSRLSVTRPPKKFTVGMDFNWYEVDDEGRTERDRFFDWYEHVLKFKVNVFEFPNIILGGEGYRKTWYRITSAVEGAKSGLCVRVQMTWESVYEGILYAEPVAVAVDHIEASNGRVDVVLNRKPLSYPTIEELRPKINGNNINASINDDGIVTLILRFPKYTDVGEYVCDVQGKTDTFLVRMDE